MGIGTPYNTVDAYNAALVRSTPTNLSQARGYVSATTVGNYALFGGGATTLLNTDNSNIVDAYNIDLVHSTPTNLSQARGNIAATTVGNYALFGGGYITDDSNVFKYYDNVDAYVAS